MNDETGIDRSTPGWRISQVVGSILALVCAVFGLPLWWHYVTFIAKLIGYDPLDNTEIGLMMFGFLIWFIPIFAVVLLLIGLFGWKRKAFAKIITAVASAITLVAIVVSIMAAT